MGHERGDGRRRTPEEQLAYQHERYGIGKPPPLSPAAVVLAEEFPDDPVAEPEKARAAIAKAQALGARLGRGNPVNTVDQRRSAGELPPAT